MDRVFMRDYCVNTYDELYGTATKDNEEYRRLKECFEAHEKAFEKALGDQELFRMYEDVMSDYIAMEYELCLDVYALGAADRERMLR